MTRGKTLITAALLFTLSAALMAGCSSQPAASSSASENESTATQATGVDTSSWKTMADALAVGDSKSAMWNDKYYVCGIGNDNGALFRVVAEVTPDFEEKYFAVDPSDADYDKKQNEIVGTLKVVSVEDLTPKVLGKDVLDAYVGKTGQDVIGDGFTFVSYSMYGGDETMAAMDKDNISYNVTFDGTVPDDKDDNGDSLKELKVKSIEVGTISDSALDPASVK
jgi:hypothetical protein